MKPMPWLGRLVIAFVLIGLVFSPSLLAQPVVIDFENLPASNVGTPATVFVTDQYDQLGISFNGPAALNYSAGLLVPSDFAHSGAIAIEQCYAEEFCTAPITMSFTEAQARVKVWVGFSSFFVESEQSRIVVLQAFNATGEEVGRAMTEFLIGSQPISIRTPLEVTSTSANIASASVQLLEPDGDVSVTNSLAVDDVEFEAEPGQPTITTIVLPANIRDFSATHPDFQATRGDDPGIVEEQLGADLKPVYASDGTTLTTSGQENFDQWYRDTEGVNLSMPFAMTFENIGTSENPVYLFREKEFFPIDNQLLGNEERNHNFHFTLELHAQFTYNGGGFVDLRSDDDAWLFINGKLVIDLGGVHPIQPLPTSVNLADRAEDLELIPGETYNFDLFFAERRTSQSALIIKTSLGLMPGQGCIIQSREGDELGIFVLSCVGTPEDDVIDCVGGNNVVDADAGNDVVNCSDGDDMIFAGPGNDVVHAGAGNDDVFGEEGNDVLNGNEGNDILVGGAGNDILNGDEGDDVTIAEELNGGDGPEVTVDNDNVTSAFNGLTVNARRLDRCPTGSLPIGEDVHSGGAGSDMLCGSNGPDTMYGRGDDDDLFGFGGADVLFGNARNDTINGGGNRNDSCRGGPGNNIMIACPRRNPLQGS